LLGSAPNAGVAAAIAARTRHRQIQRSFVGPTIWDDLLIIRGTTDVHAFEVRKATLASIVANARPDPRGPGENATLPRAGGPLKVRGWCDRRRLGVALDMEAPPLEAAPI